MLLMSKLDGRYVPDATLLAPELTVRASSRLPQPEPALPQK